MAKEHVMREKEAFKRLVRLLLSGGCLVGQVLIYVRFLYRYFFEPIKQNLEFFEKGEALFIAIYAVLIFFFSNMYGGMRIGYLKNGEVIFSQIFATFLANIVTYGQISIMITELFEIRPFFYMLVMQIAWAVIWINISTFIYRHIFAPRRMLLIHGDRPYDDILAKFNTRKDKYDICKCISYRTGYDTIFLEILEGYEGIVIWDIPVDVRNKILKFCYGHSIRVYIMPKITDVILKGAEQLSLFDTPILFTREYKMTVDQRFWKRFIDIICSLILIVITSPLMILTALAVKLYDGGPILYKQVRCTLGGKEFKIMKFRSMSVDAEKDGKARLASKHDTRITPVGKFIRVCRLDELPQLFNILKGDMSFIGPRPERPEIIAQYMEIMPEFKFRMRVKAGLAGYAQVYGKYNTTPYDKLKLDLYYIENYSIWMDIKLMFLTLKILLMPDSTEGIESTQITAMKQSNEEFLARREKLDEEARERVEREHRERAEHEARVLERQCKEKEEAEKQEAERKETEQEEENRQAERAEDCHVGV